MGRIYDQAVAIRDATQIAGRYVPDDEAAGLSIIFAPWEAGVDYVAGDKRKHNGELYKCLSAHTSQAGWEPGVAPSLWVRIDDPAIEWPEWRQPTMAEDAYAKGAKVTHNGKRYISQIDANTTEPGTDERWWREA